MANGNDFNQTVGALFKGMDSFLSTKTVVGEPTKIGDTIIVPLVDVNFGVAAGAMGKTNGSNNAGGGMGGKMSPSAVLVIQNGYAKMVSVKEQDTISKVLDMIPEVVDKAATFFKKDEKSAEKDAIDEAISELKEEEI